MENIIKLIDTYGREALERLGKQASSGNREAATILVNLAANCVWPRERCKDCPHKK